MAEDRRPDFEKLAEDWKDTTTAEQQALQACSNLMEKIIRPSMREARKAIQHPGIVWGEGERPSIKIFHHKLIYECFGQTLYMEKTIDGYNEPQKFPVHLVTKELIVQQIDAFLRAALDIKP
jgi:hypothetical protein